MEGSPNHYYLSRKLHLERSQNISIRTSQSGQDVQRFVDSELEELIAKKSFYWACQVFFRKKIVEVPDDGAQGMFRWVA